jgi:hypothetical protein
LSRFQTKSEEGEYPEERGFSFFFAADGSEHVREKLYRFKPKKPCVMRKIAVE